MDNTKIQLAVGSLLHDTGKIIYRSGSDGRKHSISGYEFVKRFVRDKDLLDCIRYHHADLLKNADVDKNALCYITYIADNIASMERRKDGNAESGGQLYDREIPLYTIFNRLNGKCEKAAYPPVDLIKGNSTLIKDNSTLIKDNSTVNYPQTEKAEYDKYFYNSAVEGLESCLNGIEFSKPYIDSLIQIWEAYASYIPSSTDSKEICDISLFQHVKMTAAFALCIYDYLQSQGECDYKSRLFSHSMEFYDEKAFLIFSADISGIQDFIYNISGKGASKGLRSRSFYLEILMESVVDELIDRLELTRTNVVYTGGGHTYMLLPNTEKTKTVIASFERELNDWFIENFGTQLFIGTGYAECSANELSNSADEAYSDVFKRASRQISISKLRRYNSEQLKKLNFSYDSCDGKRECRVCNRSDRLVSDDNGEYICTVCKALSELSDAVLGSPFFAILKGKPKGGVILPFGNYLVSCDTEQNLKSLMENDPEFVRCYGINKFYTGKNLSTRLWVGNYCSDKQFSNLSSEYGQSDKHVKGIKRIAVLRADVDNLGQAFSIGLEKGHASLSRTAELSGELSLFFKYYINTILNNPEFSLVDKKPIERNKRNINIIYSGGDDVFAVGYWRDIIEFAVDLSNALEKYTLGSLTISAGIGIFKEKFPIYQMAVQTGRLEEISKENEGKNSITLFDETGCYHWKDFTERVVGEKLSAVMKFIDVSSDKGNAMLYNIISLIRECDSDKLNIARFAYLCARLKETADNKDDEIKKQYEIFSEKLYGWIHNETDRKQLTTAIYLYVYFSRKSNEEGR